MSHREIAGASHAAIRCKGKIRPGTVLTPRQSETLRMIVEDKNTKEIAAALGISTKTVDFHRAELMKRLRTRTVAGLVREAIRRKLDPGTQNQAVPGS